MQTDTNHTNRLSANALRVLESRYLQRNKEGVLVETPLQLFQRVAKAVAEAELSWGTAEQSAKWKEKFFALMQDLRFLPNSPTLMNAGTTSGQLSACFVIPVEDQLEAIFSSLTLTALVQQGGGGTGFNFSHLRPRHDRLCRTQGTASGPVSFMDVFNAAPEHIKQGGRRRGANMGILNIDHPDIEEFICAKTLEGRLSNFNISVGVSEAFMQAVQRGESWKLIHPNTHKTTKIVKARQLWQLIVEQAWKAKLKGVTVFRNNSRTRQVMRQGIRGDSKSCKVCLE